MQKGRRHVLISTLLAASGLARAMTDVAAPQRPFSIILSRPFRAHLYAFVAVLVANMGYYFIRIHWIAAYPRKNQCCRPLCE